MLKSTVSSLLTGLYAVYKGESNALASLTTNLYAVYKGESNANDSLGVYNGTAQGGLTYSAGKSGNAFTFNGTNAYVSLPNNTFNSFTGDFSFNMWVNLVNTGANQSLLSCKIYDGTNSYGVAVINLGYNLIQICNGTASVVTLQESAPNPYNTWYMVTITRKASTGTKIYYNGSLSASNSNTTNPVYHPSTATKCAIGALDYSTSFGGIYYYLANGSKIDEVNVWTKELTSTEVTDLYNAGNGKFYQGNAFYSTIVNDSLGVYNGTAQGGLTYGAGKSGNAFTFNGTNAIINLPNTSGQFNFTGDFTVSTWFRSSNLSSSRYFIYNLQDTGTTWGYGWSFFYSSSLGFAFQLNNGAVNNQVNFQSSYSPNVWYHVVVVRTMGQKSKIYVNAVDTPATQTGNVNTTAGYITNQKMDLGGISSLNLFALCDLDEVNMWNRALTATEVTELYNTGTGKFYPY